MRTDNNFKNLGRRAAEISLFKYFSVGTIYFWLILFALVPIVLIITASLLSHDTITLLRLPFTFDSYGQIINLAYGKIFLYSVKIAGGCTLLCLLVGYPFAFIIARSKLRYRTLLLLFVIIPFWTSSLIRTYAIMAILKAKGILNTFLLWLGIIHQPLQMLYSDTAVFIGLMYALLPFMILPLYATIEKLDSNLLDAARDLGANRFTIFIKIILPLTMPGIVAGVMLVLLPAMTMFYIPVLLGGAKSMLLGNLIQNQFLDISNWPMGSAISVALLFIMAIMMFIYWKVAKNNKGQELV